MKKRLKTVILVSALLILGLLFIRFVLGGPEDDWICRDGVWVKHGNPAQPSPSGVCEK